MRVALNVPVSRIQNAPQGTVMVFKENGGWDLLKTAYNEFPNRIWVSLVKDKLAETELGNAETVDVRISGTTSHIIVSIMPK